MITIKTKEAASCWIGLLATAIVAGVLFAMHAKGVQIRWIPASIVLLGTFAVVMLVALFIIRKYVAYKLKPIYSIVLSRNVHTAEIFSELKDKKVENIGEELTAWADTNDKEIARLKEAERFRKQYLGNVAHELKTPIAVANAANDALLDFGAADDATRRARYLRVIREQLAALGSMVERILTMSVEERGDISLRREELEIRPLLEEVAARFRMKSRGRATIEVEVEDPDLKISADRFHLTHALDNLVDNALKYSGETVRIRLSARHAGKGVELRVADNGIGIDCTAQAHIFEKFYRVPTGDRHDVKGFGLGLYYVWLIARKHGGEISVESTPGCGSPFKLTLSDDER